MAAKIRLHYPHSLSANQVIVLDKAQSHYLANVMRVKLKQSLLCFNDKDGEWLANVHHVHKKETQLRIIEQTKMSQTVPDITLCFAPVKNAPMHYLIQKSTELGIRTLQPVTTEHTVVHKINYDRLHANAVEAAEQCGRTCLPEIETIRSLKDLLAEWDPKNSLVLCDESGKGKPIGKALADTSFPLSILIGPEGGFSKDELTKLHQKPYVIPIGLGPRILRADTAAIASISCIMSLCGDWNKAPKFEAS